MELPIDVQQWVLDLRYAWARQRSAPSALVLRACDELEDRIYKETDQVRAHFQKAFPKQNPSELCQEWLSAIMIMRSCAEQSEVCTWTMRPQAGEVDHFLGLAMRLLQSMVATQNSERAGDEQIPPPAVLNVIQSKSEAEQIAFINSVVDGLADPKAEPSASNAAPPPR